VSLILMLLIGAGVSLMTLLAWILRSPERLQSTTPDDSAPYERSGRRHPTYFPVIRQAMSPSDLGFLAERGSTMLVRRAHRERQRIALSYLAELRGDFERLLRLARVIAVLSPQVRATREFERLRLTLLFSLRYHTILWALRFGLLLLPQLCELSVMVSALASRLESAMSELGERAILATELASSLHRRGLDMA
jgi:hypothetical protein